MSAGSSVDLVLTREVPPHRLVVNVMWRSLEQATAVLNAAGLSLGSVQPTPTALGGGRVWRVDYQFPPPHAIAPVGAAVAVHVFKDDAHPDG